MTSPLISASALRALLASGAPLLLADCRNDLADPGAGQRAHERFHLPGALYFHLDRDLSAPPDGRNGRHPLPTREAFAERLAARGFADHLPVVAYDASGGMYAARLWCMLRWLGHEAVQVLDGGMAAWDDAGGALQAGPLAPRGPGRFPPGPPPGGAGGFGEGGGWGCSAAAGPRGTRPAARCGRARWRRGRPAVSRCARRWSARSISR